jgi:hypothetical protein
MAESSQAQRMLETNTRFLVLLCREEGERYQSLSIAEDMCVMAQNFIFYEIVHRAPFNFYHHPNPLS